ncbi:hypothetical protein L7F22_018747 [Adiantum nelumboides]|nr:hypothetical protein [Adiantum nelumboides]
MSNQPSSLKARLAQGHLLYGGSFCSSSPPLAKIMGYCGFDYVVVDMEHGPGSTLDALPCLQALKAAGPSLLFEFLSMTRHGPRKPSTLGLTYGLDIDYPAKAEDSLLIMLQIEYEKGVKNVAKIAAIDGVDCIMMGAPVTLAVAWAYATTQQRSMRWISFSIKLRQPHLRCPRVHKCILQE